MVVVQVGIIVLMGVVYEVDGSAGAFVLISIGIGSVVMRY